MTRFVFILSGVVFTISLLFGFLAWLGPEPQSAAEEPTARQIFEQALAEARAGNSGAQRQVAAGYLTGEGVPADAGQAAKWLTRAAERGDAEAQYQLGRLYEAGTGVRADYRKAAELYERAATRGNLADAQLALGELAYRGRGVINDYAEAVKWYRLAAENGQPVAQYLLGVMYGDGWGVEKDVVQAYRWYTRAMPAAARVLAHDPAYDPAAARRKLAAGMSRHQIEQAERLAAIPGDR